MKGYSFSWREDRYRLDRGTLAFWPDAKLIARGNLPEKLLCATDVLFCQTAAILVLDVSECLDPESVPECVKRLVGQCYSVRRIGGALSFIRDHPETIQAELVMRCISRRYFVARVLPA